MLSQSGPVVWLNRNYATTVHFIGQLRDNPAGREITVIGSHRDPLAPMLAACDLAFPEPDLTGADYADFALRFCLDHHVDVFLPVHEQLAIARAADRFAAAGIALVSPPAGAIEVLADKAATYRTVAADPRTAVLVPPFREIASSDEFESAVRELSGPTLDGTGPAERLVVKPVVGVGATGVRILSESPPTLAQLTGPIGHGAGLQDFVQALKTAESTGVTVPRLLVMPYLDEPEISIDVLADGGTTLVAVPRCKAGRRRWIGAPVGVPAAARDLVRTFALDGLVNVQFRMRHDRPVLLEINTRPAGGLYQTGLTGVNMPWAAVGRALGDPVLELHPTLGAEYVTVSSLVALGGRSDGLSVPSRPRPAPVRRRSARTPSRRQAH